MDATLRGLVRLIDEPDVETRCAALVVLSRLHVSDPAVVRAVGAALEAKNAVVRDFAVGYFEQVHPRDGVGYLLPLLDSPEEALRSRAVNALVHYRQAAVMAAKKTLREAPRRRTNAIIDLCARVHSAAACDLLVELMAGDDFDSNRAACDALIAMSAGFDAPARADLFVRAGKLAAQAKGRRTALVAAAKIFGALGDSKARGRLLPLVSKAEPHVVRTHALGALTQCLRGQKLTATEIDALLPLLDEDDETGILRPAILLLEDQTLDRRYLPHLNRLAESPQPMVKRFAVQQLGNFDTGGVVKTLIGYLTDDSYARRDQATVSLKTLPAARPALMKEFLACEDERKAWTLADILLVHERGWKRDVLDALWNRLRGDVETRDDRLYTAYAHFLRTLDADALAQRIRGRAAQLRKAKKFILVARWLGLLKESPAFDSETKFELAIAELKSHHHRVGSPGRRHDPASQLLRELCRSSFPVAERLRKERILAPDELFYIAFNLAEDGGEERTVSQEVLAHLVAKHGRTKVGRAAKNKLRLLGQHTRSA